MLLDLLQNVRFADIIDILLVAVMLYGLLVWLRRTASLTVLVGAPIVAAVYIAAQTFQMYLTSMIFHGLFAVVLIGLIILFQDDLRRTLGRRSSWWFRSKQQPTASAAELDALVQTLFDLAAARTGALLVLVGREPVDAHTEGGIRLGGRFSVPLLCSLFDPHSPGHDGAVILEDWRVKSFGVHLPLSKNLAHISGRGTRHSAALGLSERTDALVIVVSEERGTVGVAEDGRLVTVASQDELRSRIDRWLLIGHHRHLDTAKKTPRWSKNWALKLLALVLACLGWGLLAYQPELVERSFEVPIEYRNVAEHLSLDGVQPIKAQVTLSGRESAFSVLEPDKLKVSLDLSKASRGYGEVLVVPKNVQHPANLSVTRIEPPTIRYRLVAQP